MKSVLLGVLVKIIQQNSQAGESALVSWIPCVTQCLLCRHFHPKLLRNVAVLSPVGMAASVCVK